MIQEPVHDASAQDSEDFWYIVPKTTVPTSDRLRRIVDDAFRELEGRIAGLLDPIRYDRDDPAPRKGYRDDELLNRVLSRCRVSGLAGCYEWQLSGTAKGYGRMRVDGKLYLPHRVAAYAAGIVDSLSDPTRKVCVLHECDNPRCCRPEHLKAGTMSQNMKDCVARGRHKVSKR